MARPLIILGASVRAAARSALRAGYQPWCIDLFADRDLRALAPVKQCPADNYPGGMLPLLFDAPQAPVLFTGAMENHPQLIERIAMQRPLLGSSPAAVFAARDPATLTQIPFIERLRVCSLWMAGQVPARRSEAKRELLLKPISGGGGRGIDWWNSPGNAPVPLHHVVQNFVSGTPISAVYTAGIEGLTLLGATEQIIGDAMLGAGEFQYAGSLGPIELTPSQLAVLRHVGEAVVQKCGLQGVFGIDFIRDDQEDLWPIEINPRYPASAEVIEAVTGVSVLNAHPQSWAGALTPPQHAFHGKAIAFAPNACRIPDLYRWFTPEQIADVPAPYELTPAHRPICTLFASASDPVTCRRRLHDMARQLYTRLEYDGNRPIQLAP